MNMTCLSSIGSSYENDKGDNCAINNPDILITFKKPNLVYISKVQIQRETFRYPANPGNIRQIEAIFLDANNSMIKDEVSGEPITWTSPEDNPIINGYFKNVRGLILKVLKTDKNQPVRRLRVEITGCYSAGLNI